jgi:DNA gyrase subunit B
MTEIIERGYLYIAQPPLFKIGKGKNEQYLKNESEFNDFILKKICEKVKVRLNGEQLIDNHTLYLFVGNLTEYFEAVAKLENQGIPPVLIDILIQNGVEDKNFLQDRNKMEQLCACLQQNGYDAKTPEWNAEREVFEIRIAQKIGGKVIQPIKLGRGLIYSSEYQKCVNAGKYITPYNLPPFAVTDGENQKSAVIFEDQRSLLKYLVEEGKKGITVQRYKGLGEMNPEQLWETTMNPSKRILLQVNIEDMVESDEIFTILMGDEVEPRREFIHNNALEVSSLDI